MRVADVFDVAIVGAGSAGCALAGRLAARTDLRIALIEAGPDYGPRTSGHWPAELLDAHHSPDTHDWGFEQARARVVGGCSVHNECALVRALPGDYDRWAVPGWTDAELAPLIAELARNIPTRVCRDDELTAWQRAFLDSALDAGFPRLAHGDDAPGGSGVAPFVQNIKDDLRWNAAFAYLDAVRSRVAVISDVLVDRLMLEGDRARLLIAHGSHGAREIHAERFVLSGGVYGSPMILLRSGVGPPGHLKKLRIPIHAALPGVGANLHDHPGVGIEYQPTTRALRAVKEDVKARRFYEAQIVLKTPDLHVVPYQTQDAPARWSFGVLAYYLSPRSRGRVRLTSRDPEKPPALDLGLLKDRHDVDTLIDGAEIIHELTRRVPLAEAIARGPRWFKSRARRARFVRSNVTDYAHPVGTCRMGLAPEAGDVVDARGRVHGLANVFVADASVMPQIPRANINLTCFVIGARVADFLLSAPAPRPPASRPPSP